MKIIYYVISILILVSCSSIEKKSLSTVGHKKYEKRSINNFGQISPAANCQVTAITSAGERITLEKKLLSYQQLEKIHPSEKVGYYFDIYSSGGFRLSYLRKSSSYHIEIDAEDAGVVRTERVSRLPFEINHRTRLEFNDFIVSSVSLSCKMF